jgi:tetratricopeptide (TPR) repeat protein
MNHGKDNDPTWQELEREGDSLWEEAFWTDTLEDSLRLWSDARVTYQKALREVSLQNQEPLAVARLYRKMSACYRKGGQVDRARENLEEARRIVKTLRSRAGALLEEAHIGLEIAYCYYLEGEWDSQLREAENVIETIEICRGEPLCRQSEVQCSLGHSYNLLAIALDASSGAISRLGKNPDECWNRAEDFFQSADNPEGERGKLDLMINRAERLRRRGHCDRAIEILEGVLSEKLPPQRTVVVRDNLAAAYLDRLDSDDIDKAVKLAEQNLEHAKQHRDIREWIWALEVRLKTMKEEINVSDEEERPTLLGKAFALYNRGLDLVRAEELGKREASSARLELDRVMTEIYLAVGEIQKASVGIEFIEESIHSSEWQPDTEWDTGDIFVTFAMFDREQQRLEQALNNLKQARMWFQRGDHQGMVVETEIKRAKTHILREAWFDAQMALEEALGIAHQLECQRRIKRIEDLLGEVAYRRSLAQRPTEAIEVFFSYAHEDEELRDELEKHLSILKRQGVITSWHDRKIGAGKEWEGEIDIHLNMAHVILLLISPDFIASDYCWDIEVKRAMERHEAKEARVIPVILRPVDWKGAPFSKLQALPKDAKPVISWANRDEALLEVARGIRAAIEELGAEDNSGELRQPAAH